jgi:hypothetical protein
VRQLPLLHIRLPSEVGGKTMNRHVLQSDEDIADECPTCHAGEGAYCVNKQTGEPSHICCVARLKRVLV